MPQILRLFRLGSREPGTSKLMSIEMQAGYKRLSNTQAEALAMGRFRASNVSASTLKRLYVLGLITRRAEGRGNLMPPGSYRISERGKRALNSRRKKIGGVSWQASTSGPTISPGILRMLRILTLNDNTPAVRQWSAPKQARN